jgi:hypothetical protein
MRIVIFQQKNLQMHRSTLFNQSATVKSTKQSAQKSGEKSQDFVYFESIIKVPLLSPTLSDS